MARDVARKNDATLRGDISGSGGSREMRFASPDSWEAALSNREVVDVDQKVGGCTGSLVKTLTPAQALRRAHQCGRRNTWC